MNIGYVIIREDGVYAEWDYRIIIFDNEKDAKTFTEKIIPNCFNKKKFAIVPESYYPSDEDYISYKDVIEDDELINTIEYWEGLLN